MMQASGAGPHVFPRGRSREARYHGDEGVAHSCLEFVWLEFCFQELRKTYPQFQLGVSFCGRELRSRHEGICASDCCLFCMAVEARSVANGSSAVGKIKHNGAQLPADSA